MGQCGAKIQREPSYRYIIPNENKDNNNLMDYYDGEEQLSYFMQIKEVTNEKFTVRLDTKKRIDKRIKYDLKHVLNADADELCQITIPKNKSFGTDDVYFENNNDNNYQVSIYDEND
eukprot:212622_1